MAVVCARMRVEVSSKVAATIHTAAIGDIAPAANFEGLVDGLNFDPEFGYGRLETIGRSKRI